MPLLTSFLDNSPLGVIETDPHLRVTGWGGRAEELFGWTQSEAEGRLLCELKLTSKEDEENFQNSLDYLAAGAVDNKKMTFQNYTRSGKEIRCQWYFSVQKNIRGEVISINALADDITESCFEQDNILKLKKRFELIDQATQHNIWDWDMASNTIWVNDNYIKTFGYNPLNYTHFHEEWVSRIHPEDKERCLEIMRSSLENKHSISETEFRFKLADGSYGNILSRASILLDQTGVPVRWVGALVDITDKKVAEHKLAASEEKYRQLVDNMAEGLGMQDKEGTIRFMNKRACEMLGYMQDELVGQRVSFLFDETNQEIYNEQMLLRSKGFTNSFEIEWTCKDGNKLSTIVNPRTILNEKNEVTGNIAVFTDITKRKAAEEKLARSEIRLRTILEAEPDCIKLLDRQGCVVEINPSGLHMLEAVNIDEVLGSSVLKMVLPAFQQPFNELIENVFNGKSGKLEFQCSGLKGNIKWLETDAVPLKNEKGEVINVLAVTRDITENKNTLLALKQSESKFRRIFESDLIGFIFYDINGNIIEANNKFSEMVGYPADDLSSGQLRWRDITPPEYTGLDNEALKEIQQKGSCEPYEKQFIRKDGSRFHLILGAVSINKEEGLAYIIDNSHRKKVERRLRKTNALLADIQKLSHVGTWEWFPKVDKVVWSDEMFNILGFEPQQFEVTTQSLLKYIHPDDREMVRNTTMESLLENKSKPLEFRIIRKNGEIRHVYGLGYALLNKNNQMDRMVGSLQDITDRKLAEYQIRKEKQLSDSIINSLPGIFYLFDEFGKMLRWNENMERITGYTSAEIENMRPEEFIDTAERDMISNKIADILKHGVIELEAFILTKSGEKIPFYFTGSRVVFESRVCIIGMGMNISERRKAERQLKENEQQLDVIYNTVRDIIYMLSVEKDGRYRFISINQRFLESTGLKENQVNGQFVNEVIPEPSLTVVLEKYRESITTKKTVTWKESTEYPTGTKVALVTVSPVMDEEGNCIKLVGSVRDITEREEAEKEIKERNEQLHQLSVHLQNIREEERASVAREIHDELGQQLTVIKMDVSWINKKIQSEEEKIKQKIQNLLSLVDSAISTVRKISSDLRPSILDDFGLKEALQWQISEFEKRTGISCHFVAGIPDKKLDKKISISLFRIFQESLTNVARHAEAHNVWAVIKSRSGNLELTITDDGKGMDVSSMGLKHTMGLIGMKERVKMTEGSFNLISTPGKGTIVRVAVPFEDVVTPANNTIEWPEY